MSQNNEDLKKLQTEWYKKIKDEGFKDIEQDEDRLKFWSSSFFKHKAKEKPGFQEAKEEYYRVAGHFLHEYEFTDDREKAVWELHADGVIIVEIVSQLKKRGFKVYKSLVQTIISKLAKIMCANAKK